MGKHIHDPLIGAPCVNPAILFTGVYTETTAVEPCIERFASTMRTLGFGFGCPKRIFLYSWGEGSTPYLRSWTIWLMILKSKFLLPNAMDSQASSQSAQTSCGG